MYTNEYGDLMTLDGERHPDYLGKSMSLPLLTGTTSARVPMKGTVFLNVPKADGANFPLKLNIKKHSQSEAELIAGLLTSVIKGENKFDTPFSELKGDFKESLMNSASEQINALMAINKEKIKLSKEGNEKEKKALLELKKEFDSNVKEMFKTEFDSMVSEDPSLIEIIDFFTYVSPKTEGKSSELFISGEWVKFGNSGMKVTPKSLFNHEKLVEFLVNTKRKQFNIGLWAASPAYRDYAISSGLINTDAVVDGPLFGGNTGIYIKAPAGTKPLPVNPAKMLQHTPTVQGEKPKSERRKMSEKAGTFSDRSTNGKFAATYYGKDGIGVEILGDTAALATQAVSDKYNAETSTGPATKTVVATQPAPAKKQDDMSNLPTQDTSNIPVVIKKKSGKGNHNLVIKDGGGVYEVVNGKELEITNPVLVNKALLKSGVLKYQKIIVGKQVYAATTMNTIINITPGSPSNGNTILAKSAIGSKVMAQYTRKFTGKVTEVGAEEITTASGEDLVREMLKPNGKMITDFTVEEQSLIHAVPLVTKQAIKTELDNLAYEAEIEASRNPEEEIDNAVAVLVKERDAAMKKAGIMKLDFIALDGPGNTAEHKKNEEIINAAEDAKQLIYDQYQAKIDDLIESFNEKKESPKISDPRMLLMGMNSVDLSNETAIKQEQSDINSLDSINASTNVFDMALEADLDPVIPVPKKVPEPTSPFAESDSAYDITNLFEDEYGCGFI
jgi:hypothetical protein